MALKMKPVRNRTHVVEQWLDTLTPEARDEAVGYLREPDLYGHLALRDAFRHDGYNGSEGAIKGWRDRHARTHTMAP